MLLKSIYPVVKKACGKNRFFKYVVFHVACKVNVYPKILTIALTYKCQCHCAHCGITGYIKEGEKEPSTDEVKKLIDEASRIRSIVQVTFTGGEVLLRRDIMDLIRYSRAKGFFTKIDSNGGMLTANALKELKSAGLSRIDISIDHYDGEIHDKLRGCKGLFGKVSEALRICRDLKIPYYLQTYATRQNIHDGSLEKTLRVSEKLGAMRTKIQPPATFGRWENKPEVALEEGDYFLLEQMLARHPKAYFESEFFSPRDYQLICKAGLRGNIYVTCYGDVFPCCYVPVSFGNIKGESLRDILGRMYGGKGVNAFNKYGSCLCNNSEFQAKLVGK